MPNPRPEHVYEIVREIRPLYRALVRAVDVNLDGSGLTVASRGVLEQLRRGGRQTVPDIGRALDLPRQFVQKLINGVQEAGLVHTRPNPAHRRSPLIELTDAGTTVLGDVQRRELEVLRRVCADLDDADVAACIRVLNRLSRYFAREEGNDL